MVNVGGQKKKGRFSAKIAEYFELPSDVVLDLPRLILTGDQQLVVENHRGLKLYSRTEVCLQTTVGLLTVSGEALNIKLITTDQVEIDGRIAKVEWGGQGEEP
ncbi:MAG TPA: sporulation protein YqfC [Hydrogenispora sp.]|jgi:sporulation protein YqfC|nr:sporulation protein YqfC [Hydrogenispora sp.]